MINEATQLATFQASRLPWHPKIQETFGVDKAQWKTLVEAIYPNAQSVDSVALALSYCKSRGLDPMKRPVHIVPVWSSQLKRMTETVWPGINELRTTAMRTRQYAGCERTEFGPSVMEQLGSKKVTYPEWAEKTVYRMLDGLRCAFVGPKVYWKESYATAGKDDPAPNAMWFKRPSGQLEKCAEAAALRAAFPEEIGNEYAAEEMEGQHHEMVDITPPPEEDHRTSGNEALKEKLTTRGSRKRQNAESPTLEDSENQEAGNAAPAPAEPANSLNEGEGMPNFLNKMGG